MMAPAFAPRSSGRPPSTDRRTRSDSVKPAERALRVPLHTLRPTGANLHPYDASEAHDAP